MEGIRLSESVRKGKLVTKIFFSDNVEWSSKNLWKMMSAGVKCNTKQIKDLVAVSYKFFLRSTLKSWEIQCKKVVFFIWFWLVFHPSWYWTLRAGDGGLLHRQNLLSVTKVICWQSLGHYQTYIPDTAILSSHKSYTITIN